VPCPAIPLPYDLGDEGTGYLRQVWMMLVRARGPFVLVANTHDFFHGRSVPFRDLLDHMLGPVGVSSRPIGRLGTVSVVTFERISEPSGPGGS